LGNTIWLAIFFTFLQYFEYVHSTFTLADGVYGSTFYMTTGFHGLHVIIGTIFLSVAGYRLVNGEFTPKHHLGFEFGSWYWHFVDVVWLFLFFVFYI
jgi:cytochrome c oxidase subunit 3